MARRGRGASDEDDDDDDDDVDYDRGGSGRVTRASRAATRSRSEAVDETAGTTSRAGESIELGGGGSSAVASDADASDMDERPVMEEIVTRGARGGESSSRRAAAPGPLRVNSSRKGRRRRPNIPRERRGRGRRARTRREARFQRLYTRSASLPGTTGGPRCGIPWRCCDCFPRRRITRRRFVGFTPCWRIAEATTPRAMIPRASFPRRPAWIFRTGTSCSSSRTRVCRTSCATPSV